MSREYAERRIKDALRQANGNVTRARQQIIAWTYEDAKLLHELVKPHINGIVAYQLERMIAAEDEGEQGAQEQAVVKKVVAAGGSAKPNEFGIELLKAVASSNPTMFGQEIYTNTPKRGKASKQHMDALRQLASKSSPDTSE